MVLGLGDRGGGGEARGRGEVNLNLKTITQMNRSYRMDGSKCEEVIPPIG